MQEILDKKQAIEQAGGNETLAKELFGMLLQDLPVLQEQLRSAIAEQQSQTMWDSAHKLYGSTAYCGVPALRECARVMEECIKQQDNTRLGITYDKLEQEIQRLLEKGPQLLQDSWQT